MRRSDGVLLGLTGGLLLVAAIPVVAQRGPESLLPPGFGEPDQAAPPAATPEPANPVSPAASGVDPRASSSSLPLDLPDESALGNAAAVEDDEKTPDEYDLPDTARRSLAQIGPLTATTGGVSPQSFGAVRGQYLAGLMRATNAPIVSRWASILLRRVLMSGIATPADINGADLAAERAALLLRMGEADNARLIVQSVDTNNFTPRLYDVAMQTYLATADPAGFCPLVPVAVTVSKDPRWQMAQAICASFGGDQGTATSMLNLASRRGALRGIDYRLGEKTVGSGPNSRRSVKIEWDGVGQLNAWRFGLATAANVEIPDGLFATTGDEVRAWEARAPMLSLSHRLAGVSAASRLGVFSGDALIAYYAAFGNTDDTEEAPGNLFETFRDSYAGDTIGTRVKAMHDFWSIAPGDGIGLGPGDVNYAALPAISRAASAIPPSAEVGADMPWLIAAMLSGGHDRNAANWVRAVDALTGEGKERAWALLAVGLPDTSAGVTRDKVEAFVTADQSANKVASRMLLAALTGLGRIGGADAQELATNLDMKPPVRSRWAKALNAAAARREKGTVALLAAVGMQTRKWASLPPAHLTAILAAMRQVGLDPEARMIAAEAVTRL